MIREEYKKAFTDILPDPALEARTERMAIEMRMNMNTRTTRRFSAVLVAAIVFILAAGIAVAATIQSGILDGLFIYGEPTEAAQEAVIHGGDSATDEGVTLAVTEYLMDGNSLHVAWDVTSEREESVYYLTNFTFNDGGAAESQTIGGSYGGYSSNEVGDNRLMQLTPDRSSCTGYMGYGYQSAPDVPVEATIYIRAFTTELTPVEMSNDLIFRTEDAELKAYLAIAEANEIGVTPEGWSNLDDYPAYQEAYEALMADYDSESDPDDEIWNRLCQDALVESGLMQPLTELSVTVTVPVQTSDPAKSAGVGESEFVLPDRRVVIREFSMDVASTVLTYDIYPNEEINLDGNWAWDGWWYLLADPEGNVLNPALGLGLGASTNDETRADGEPLCITVSCSGNPATEIPEYVTFVPVCQLERGENENSFDYYQRMAALADPEDCFTVNLAGGE